MAQLIRQIVGHKKQLDHLLQMVTAGSLPTAFIFYGPSGVGKKSIVKALLQIINCKNEALACGHCSNCIRVLEDKNELIYELKPELKKSISVDQVRELHQYLSLKSMHKARFVIVNPADALSKQASNSLLKVLEETPPETYFFLLTDRIHSLLPTIRSRSISVGFNKLSREELVNLQRFDEFALEWSDGRLAMAEEMAEVESIERLNQSLRLLYSLTCEEPQDWKKTAPWFFLNEDNRRFSFMIWNQALEKRIHKVGKNLEWLPEDSGAISDLYHGLDSLKKDIRGNVDKQLALENFYYHMRRN